MWLWGQPRPSGLLGWSRCRLSSTKVAIAPISAKCLATFFCLLSIPPGLGGTAAEGWVRAAPPRGTMAGSVRRRGMYILKFGMYVRRFRMYIPSLRTETATAAGIGMVSAVWPAAIASCFFTVLWFSLSVAPPALSCRLCAGGSRGGLLSALC